MGRFNRDDIDAILQGITTYKKAEFKVNEIPAESLSDLKGNPVWVPYTEADRAEFEKIILLCERDWFREGVTDYRIQNRIMTMKLFYDTWDMNRLYLHIKNGSFIIPKYKPLNVTEMSVITDTIKAHRKPGDTHNEIIDKCLTDWNESLKAERESAGGTDQGLMSQFIDEMYVEIFERKPTDLELAENIGQFKLYLEKLDRQKAIGKLIESLVLSTEFAYRDEFGQGESDEHGRRMMSSRNASYALSYALTDASPGEAMIKAVGEGLLSSRKDYEREIRRILKNREQWYIIDENVQATNLNSSATNQLICK